jgi:exopolysaccharide production protein ExoY
MNRILNQALLENSFEATEENYFKSDGLFSECQKNSGISLDSWRYRHAKRVMDLFGALTMVLIFAIPGILIAAAIVLTSKGPVFYRETRIGRNGRLFRIWKFRSMCQNASHRIHIADTEPTGKVLHWRMRKHLHDPRITAIGRILRKWSLDELPQCFNVLCGEMSLVGPRPIVEAEMHLYGDLFDYYLAATPGVSGFWQVSGRSDLSYRKRAELDAIYVGTWSLSSDLAILLQTIPAVLKRKGAR